MNLRIIVYLGISTSLIYGCASTGTTDQLNREVKQYSSVQDLLNKKRFNQNLEYVYDWGTSGRKQPLTVSEPKRYLQAYCHAQHGKFSLVKSSTFHAVKDPWSKKLLNTYSAVKSNTGHYKCVQKDGQIWAVTIEPTAERKQNTQTDIRVVYLMSALADVKASASPIKHQSKNEMTKATVKTAVKPVAAKAEPKVEPTVEKIPEVKVEPSPEKPAPATARQQQKKLYLDARRDINRGKNLAAACNKAEKAYNLGRVYDPTGPNIYVESGILVAKCLTTAPAYSKKFVNPKSRARGILQEIVNTQNNAVAKHMLQQLK